MRLADRHAVDLEALASRPEKRRVVGSVRNAVYTATVERAGLTSLDLIAVAVSGGPDSLVLLDALIAAGDRGGPSLHALHLDHSWHDGSAEVAMKVSAVCQERGIPITTERVSSYGRQNRESIEMAARRVRHAFFDREATRIGAVRIATGHQADDQVETVLMNLARGTGSVGLRGMRSDDGRILRPLHGVLRADIESYAGAINLNYYRDPANESSDYRRNRVRHELIPLMEDIYPGASRALTRAAALTQSEPEPIVRTAVGVRMPVAPDRDFVPAGPLRTGLQSVVRADEHATRQIGSATWRALGRALQQNVSGRWIQLPAGRWAFVRDRAIALYSERVSDPTIEDPIPIEAPGSVKLSVGRVFVGCDSVVSGVGHTPRVHAMAVPPPEAKLAIRTPRKGDRLISPVDECAHDLLRFLGRRRVPAALRAGTPILTIDDEPACIPGLAVGFNFLPSIGASKVLTVSVEWAPLKSKEAAEIVDSDGSVMGTYL